MRDLRTAVKTARSGRSERRRGRLHAPTLLLARHLRLCCTLARPAAAAIAVLALPSNCRASCADERCSDDTAVRSRREDLAAQRPRAAALTYQLLSASKLLLSDLYKL